MLINITVDNISKTVKVNEACFVKDSVIITLIVVKDEKSPRIINFDCVID
jgi:hypothetical protein